MLNELIVGLTIAERFASVRHMIYVSVLLQKLGKNYYWQPGFLLLICFHLQNKDNSENKAYSTRS